jgi:tetratricopeptide (TPR) repeat protein|nr:hypothetical protein [Kofleriaceae bacterium]
MIDWTESERPWLELFDAALRARDEGRFEEALRDLQRIVYSIGDHESRLAAHCNIQIGAIYKSRQDYREAERVFRAATHRAPRLELASLNLYHALDHLGRQKDALKEIIRFVSGNDSTAYRSLLSEGFADDLPVDQRQLVEFARRCLARFVAPSQS